jgi:hypothetical protein
MDATALRDLARRQRWAEEYERGAAPYLVLQKDEDGRYTLYTTAGRPLLLRGVRFVEPLRSRRPWEVLAKVAQIVPGVDAACCGLSRCVLTPGLSEDDLAALLLTTTREIDTAWAMEEKIGKERANEARIRGGLQVISAFCLATALLYLVHACLRTPH